MNGEDRRRILLAKKPSLTPFRLLKNSCRSGRKSRLELFLEVSTQVTANEIFSKMDVLITAH